MIKNFEYESIDEYFCVNPVFDAYSVKTLEMSDEEYCRLAKSFAERLNIEYRIKDSYDDIIITFFLKGVFIIKGEENDWMKLVSDCHNHSMALYSIIPPVIKECFIRKKK